MRHGRCHSDPRDRGDAKERRVAACGAALECGSLLPLSFSELARAWSASD
jgi:hypothetical protein